MHELTLSHLRDVLLVDVELDANFVRDVDLPRWQGLGLRSVLSHGSILEQSSLGGLCVLDSIEREAFLSHFHLGRDGWLCQRAARWSALPFHSLKYN